MRTLIRIKKKMIKNHLSYLLVLFSIFNYTSSYSNDVVQATELTNEELLTQTYQLKKEIRKHLFTYGVKIAKEIANEDAVDNTEENTKSSNLENETFELSVYRLGEDSMKFYESIEQKKNDSNAVPFTPELEEYFNFLKPHYEFTNFYNGELHVKLLDLRNNLADILERKFNNQLSEDELNKANELTQWASTSSILLNTYNDNELSIVEKTTGWWWALKTESFIKRELIDPGLFEEESIEISNTLNAYLTYKDFINYSLKKKITQQNIALY